jgi:hypothetical protein
MASDVRLPVDLDCAVADPKASAKVASIARADGPRTMTDVGENSRHGYRMWTWTVLAGSTDLATAKLPRGVSILENLVQPTYWGPGPS